MKIVNGVYTSAKIFTDTIEEYAVSQIQMLCDNPAFQGSKVRITPDVHPGKVGTIGFTATVRERILPNVVGIDIGCGITLAKLKQKKTEFQRLDKVIRENIPSGFAVRQKEHRLSDNFDFSALYCEKHINKEKALFSLGTLGSGNHFIELDADEQGTLYVAIHTGSRHLGKEVTEYYLEAGQKELKVRGEEIPYELTYLENGLMQQYVADVQTVQKYAELNREIILDELVKGMKWKVEEVVDIPHNYVAVVNGEPLIRKGAISAEVGETVVIPANMKEGILLGRGLGNPDWNYSAPHGTGRILKREEVKNHHTVSEFKKEMKGIYSSCIGKDTLDESPFAYRGIGDTREQIAATVEIEQILRPIYNFKAGSNGK